MFASTNWRLVLRHLIPAVYIPVGTLIPFAIFIAVTGAVRFDYIEQVGILLAGSSFVLVFASLASRDMTAARENVAALGLLCLLVVAVGGAASGGWRYWEFWVGLVLVGLLLGIAAAIGLRWARRWKKWRADG